MKLDCSDLTRLLQRFNHLFKQKNQKVFLSFLTKYFIYYEKSFNRFCIIYGSSGSKCTDHQNHRH